MPDLVAELAERGRSLAPDDRARLVEMLLESLHGPPISEIEESWNREIERRVAAHERGEVEVFEAEDVLLEAKRIAP
jgi:putative addiction module component (TIGR02574 family)